MSYLRGATALRGTLRASGALAQLRVAQASSGTSRGCDAPRVRTSSHLAAPAAALDAQAARRTARAQFATSSATHVGESGRMNCPVCRQPIEPTGKKREAYAHPGACREAWNAYLRQTRNIPRYGSGDWVAPVEKKQWDGDEGGQVPEGNPLSRVRLREERFEIARPRR